MEKVKWTIGDNIYRLKTPYGIASIIEQREDIGDKNAVGARYTYIARLEYQDGTIKSSESEFMNFDDAEGWVLWGCVMEGDQPEGTNLGIKRLFTSLELSEKFLPGAHIETHHQRIQRIKQLLRGIRPDVDLVSRFADKYHADLQKFMEEFPSLNWQVQGNEYFVPVNEGRVVIEEIRNQDKWVIGRVSTYYPRIEHHQGMIFKGLEALSFETAEHWIKVKLFEINHSIEEDHELKDLLTTVAFCIQVLPDDTDPIHLLRLKWIENRITEILL